MFIGVNFEKKGEILLLGLFVSNYFIWQVISVLGEEEDQVISFNLNLILCLYLQSLYLHDCRP